MEYPIIKEYYRDPISIVQFKLSGGVKVYWFVSEGYLLQICPEKYHKTY